MTARVRNRIIIAAGIAVLIAVTGFVCKPGDAGGGYGPYFTGMNASLKAAGIAQPRAALDMDRLDANIALVTRAIVPPLRYRIVMKSLPAPDLLLYIMKKAGTKRLMPFHLSHMSEMLRHAGPGTDMLPGRPFPVAAVEAFYDALPAHLRTEALHAVQWLIDSKERLAEYRDFAARRNLTLRVNLEIDVGLHRGGARAPEELAPLLDLITANPGRLVFSGFMGYDGHVTHVPFFIGSRESAIRKEFAKVMVRYAAFVDYGRNKFPSLFTGDLSFNGGGSTTYSLYDASMPVNDVAAGSCLVMPSTFDTFTLAGHIPALFLAAPVLKKMDGFGVPFIEAFHSVVAWWDPNTALTFYVSGGGWSDIILAPAGVSINALTGSPPNENMLPSQGMLNGSKKVALSVGDFVFFHPLQGDALMQFDEVLALRAGKIEARWRPFASRL